jgi:AcrR family transcriptional regulator
MAREAGNKHADRSAQTRTQFIETAQRLFAERSIDSVSLNEITVAAGQKNRNALQYHFGSREGLLQAIIDTHSSRVSELRKQYLEGTALPSDNAARTAAQALVKPLTDYVNENPTAIYYIKILSQLAALNSAILNPATTSGLSFQKDSELASCMSAAVAHLRPAEAKRRIFLTVSITFHGIADVCRAGENSDTSATLRQQAPMFEQVTLAVESLLGAPAIPETAKR